MEKFAERLKELREEKGFTQNKLEQVLNLGNGTVGKWESMKRIPKMDSIILLCKFFGVTSDYLIGLED